MAGLWILPTELDEPSNPDAPYAARSASWLLYRLTGEKYPGVTTTTDWYGYQTTQCMYGCPGFLALESTLAAGTDGAFLHNHTRYSDVPDPRILRTRGQPLISVTEIIDGSGNTISPSAASIVNNAYIIKNDQSPWNFFSGVSVTYVYGMLPPEAGRRAAATLANELIKCINNDDTCRLPDRVTSVSREGVTMTILDPQEFIKDGHTGIYEIDVFIHAANPSGAYKKPKVFSPDVPRGERRRLIT